MLCKEIVDNEIARLLVSGSSSFICPTSPQFGHFAEASAYVEVRLIGDSSIYFSRSCMSLFFAWLMIAPL
jgi:hypothetical protein